MKTAERFTVVDDGTDEASWLDARTGFIGASDTAAILGLSPYSTARDVWNSKQPGAEPIEENRFMTWGKRLESVVADWGQVDYPELGVLKPSPGLLVSTDYPFIAATPDRENEINGEVTALTEIKTGSEYTKSNWFGEFDKTPTAPLYYEVQLQQQLWVRGFDHGFLLALLGGNHLLAPRLVHADQSFIAIMLDELAAWHDKYILGQTPPPATRFDDLKAMFPGVNDRKIDASPEILAKVEKRNRLQPRLSLGKKYDDGLKGDIMAFMGDATELINPGTGATVVTWRKGVKPSQKFDEVVFAIEHPDLHGQYMRTKESGRTMQFKK